MEQDNRKQLLDDLEGLVDRLILDKGFPEPLTAKQKIDLLERLTEQWRIGKFQLKNELLMEDALDLNWLIQSDRIIVSRPEVMHWFGSGTSPVHLQRRLIEHLLIDHGRTHTVLGVIDTFIARIRRELEPVDFKRTSTGVMRCYTNTRFAAKKLRDVGLLKFTQKEAFKMWLLTLPGFVVAARSYRTTMPPIRECNKMGGIGLDKFLHDCQESVATYPDFVEALASLCEPDVDIFSSFKPTLKRCHEHLHRYWDVLNDMDMKSADVAKRSGQFIRLIDQTEGYGRFIEEFSASIQSDRLIKILDGREGRSKPQ